MTDTASPLHIYFLLDRSGSMQSMAPDVIGGFNSFLAAQRFDGPDALMTLTQFDSQDAHEVLCDSVTIDEVADLTERSFIPRGGTPLYDAMGHLIADATIGSLAGAGTVTNTSTTARTLNVGFDNSNTTFSGSIARFTDYQTNPFQVNKIGTGTLTLTGASTAISTHPATRISQKLISR